MEIVWIPIAVSREQVYWGTARLLPFACRCCCSRAELAVVTDSMAEA